ncbi:MAG: DUF5320 domain-containing protein [Candidatus Asgardarchaeia archaeon]
MWWPYGFGWGRGRGYRWRFRMTGIPGWLAYGYSPGWVGVTPTGLPPFAQWLIDTNQMNNFLQYLQQTFPRYLYGSPYATPMSTVPPLGTLPALSPENELKLLEEQKAFLEQQLQELKKRLDELKKQ